MSITARRPLLDRKGRPYQPAVSPRLKKLLYGIFGAVALLGANSVYLSSITFLSWLKSPVTYENQFYIWMVLMHLVLGLGLIGPFLIFGFGHMRTSLYRKNRKAVRAGLALFGASIVLGITGLGLIRISGLPRLDGVARVITYWLHVSLPLVAIGLYVYHRKFGPRIHWNWGYAWAGGVAVFVVAMGVMHAQDPRQWYAKGSVEGVKYFDPSASRTLNGKFIPAQALMMDNYCKKCHPDVYHGWFNSVHHFSSFNNPAYRFSIRNSRIATAKYDPNEVPRGARWCAGCHDPVPFFSGAFDNPRYDDVNDPTSQAGLTCVSCHAITNINSTTGNGDYTIEEPQQYPFAYSDNPVLQWVNNQLVKAKPAFHKKTFLKPFFRTAEFCSVCHKVSVPFALNHYKEFLRGQNHYDTYLLSGVSGIGARSFYYPPEAKTNCTQCHMSLKPSQDFGRRDFDGSGTLTIHDHLFLGANTAIAALRGDSLTVQAQAGFLRGGGAKTAKLRIDLFGIKPGGSIDGRLIAPLRPELPRLRPGRRYLLEVVIRTLALGHPFTQGTADSNELWVDLSARSGDRTIGRNGALDARRAVDEDAHFINILMLDRNGKRIDRRNPEDIFTPLYNHQIPPGAAQVVHYDLNVPSGVRQPVTLTARLQYRKFDMTYLEKVYGQGRAPELPIVTLCEDTLTLPVEGVATPVEPQRSPIEPAWQRWNDYGIGLLLEGDSGAEKGELRQAEAAFRHLTELPAEAHGQGWLNLARVLVKEGRYEEAVPALKKARQSRPPAPWWTAAWFNGLVNKQTGHLDEAIRDFQTIVDSGNRDPRRKFDFSQDYVVLNELGLTLFDRSKQERGDRNRAERQRLLDAAIDQFQKTLALDSEDLAAHYNIALCYDQLADDRPDPADAGPAAHPAASESELLAMANRLASGALRPGAWTATADRLAAAVEQFGKTRRAAMLHVVNHPEEKRAPEAVNLVTLPTLQRLAAICTPLYHRLAAADRPRSLVLADVLAAVHRQAYLALKPDDNARDRAVATYRKAHPAANRAAQSVVIYPLHPESGSARP